MAIDQDKLHEFLVKAVVDFGATFHAALIRIGDRLGLYKALAEGGSQTPGELAKRTGTAERYIREWLSNQAAGGYVTYDAATGKFHLSEEQAFGLADENSPVFLPGAFQVALAAVKAEDQVAERFKTG
jgi:DNA-binding IclR family transcriptional regulator